MRANESRIIHLDAWRFIAVTLVMLGHIAGYSNAKMLAEVIPGFSRFGRLANTGVLIFFFISGFVICRGLLREVRTNGGCSLTAFYIRRSFRILPPLWLFLAAVFVLAHAGLVFAPTAEIARALGFLANAGETKSPVLAHIWSLSFEEQFYLAFPLTFIGVGFSKGRRAILFLFLATVTTAVGARAAGSEYLAYYATYTSFLLAGCAAAVYEIGFLRVVARISAVTWALILICLVVCAAYLPREVEDWVKPALYPPLIAITVLGTPVGKRLVSAIFEHPKICYWGRISYTVYLWQQLATNHWSGAPWWMTLVLCSSVWLAAHLSWQLFERPLIKIGANYSAKFSSSALPTQRREIHNVNEGSLEERAPLAMK